jgi:phage terminase large subunit
VATQIDEAALSFLCYQRAPVAFCREQLHVDPDPWQADVLQHLALPDTTEAWISSGHGPGKTFTAALAILWAGCTWVQGVRIPCTAPKESTLLKKLWPEIYKVLSHAEPHIRDIVSWQKTGITFRSTPGQEAIPETAREPEGLAGHHEHRVLFVVEEATGLREAFWPVIRGALSTEGSKLLAISNPTRNTGGFAMAFQNPTEGSRLFRIGWSEEGGTNVPTLERSATGAQVRAWVSSRQSARWAKSVAATYGKDSNVYRVRVEGSFPLAEDDTLVPPYLVWDAYGREPHPDDLVLASVVWSGDIAGAGRDKTVTSERRGPLVRTLRPMPEANLANAGNRIADAVEAIQDWEESEAPDVLNLDTIGIGQGVVDVIRARGIFCNGVNVALPSKFQDGKMGMANQRAEFYWRLRMDFYNGTICISENIPREIVERLVEELAATKWFTTPGGKIQIVAKDKIRAELGRSPDYGDTLMLYYAAPGAGNSAPDAAQSGHIGKSMVVNDADELS